MRLDPRGAPDYSHHDYAAEGRTLYECGKRDGTADRAAGREPNHYLYRIASPEYSHAKGYREGYGVADDLGRANVGEYGDWFPEQKAAA